MFFRAATLLALASLAAWTAPKKAVTRGENEDIIITATLYSTPEEVKELLGNDLGGHFVVADVKVEPKYGKSVTVSRDDFELRNLDDNEHSTPFAPSQIAGHAALVVKRSSDATDDGTAKKRKKPTFSGGLNSTGSPDTWVGDPNLSAKLENADQPKDADLEKMLKQKELPEKTSDQPVSGLLYFAFDKVKATHLQLEWGPRGSKLQMRFKDAK